MYQISNNQFIQKILYHIGFYETFFFFHALNWHLKHKKLENISIKDIYELFYIDFLRIPKEDCKIIEMTNIKLVTRCKNDCPILDFSLRLGLSTKISCKRISEGPCKYFLRKLDKNIIFERNYNHIRPYKKDCEETIILKK